jgi:sec-independent protein translocase protein TatB
MLDFGFSEIVLTSAIALIVLGPEKLPKVARQVGNWMGRARAMARQLTEKLEREVNAEDLMRQTRKNSSAVQTGAAQTGAVETGAAQTGDAQTRAVSSAPVAFDTSYTPPALTPPQSAASAPQPAYSPQASSTPHGADWHPSPPENKSSDG